MARGIGVSRLLSKVHIAINKMAASTDTFHFVLFQKIIFLTKEKLLKCKMYAVTLSLGYIMLHDGMNEGTMCLTSFLMA